MCVHKCLDTISIRFKPTNISTLIAEFFSLARLSWCLPSISEYPSATGDVWRGMQIASNNMAAPGDKQT